MTRGETDLAAADVPTRDTWQPALPLLAGLATAALALISIGRRDLWLDEAFSVGAANQLLESYWRRSGSMALYYTILAPWKEISLDPGFLRIPSMLFAAAGVGLTVHLAFAWFGRRAACWTAVLLVPMWGVTRYAQEVRSFSLVMLLTVMSWHLLFRLEREHARRLWVIWGAVGAAAVYSHPLAGLAVATQFFAIRSAPVRPGRNLLRESAVGWGTFCVVMVPMGVSFLQPEGVVPDWVPELSRWTVSDTLTMVAGPWGVAQALVLVCLVGAAADALLHRSQGVAEWRARGIVLWLFLPATVMAVTSLVEPMMVGRYLIGSVPAAALLLAGALERRPGPGATALGVALVGLILSGQFLLHGDRGTPWREAIAVVESGLEPSTRHGVVFLDESVRIAFEVNAYESAVLRHTVPLVPAEPWGANLRYFATATFEDLASSVSHLDVIWYVHQDVTFGPASELAPTPDPDSLLARLEFCRVEEWLVGTVIEVARFEPCSATHDL